jgi:hypothetical protein
LQCQQQSNITAWNIFKFTIAIQFSDTTKPRWWEAFRLPDLILANWYMYYRYIHAAKRKMKRKERGGDVHREPSNSIRPGNTLLRWVANMWWKADNWKDIYLVCAAFLPQYLDWL